MFCLDCICVQHVCSTYGGQKRVWAIMRVLEIKSRSSEEQSVLWTAEASLQLLNVLVLFLKYHSFNLSVNIILVVFKNLRRLGDSSVCEVFAVSAWGLQYRYTEPVMEPQDGTVMGGSKKFTGQNGELQIQGDSISKLSWSWRNDWGRHPDVNLWPPVYLMSKHTYTQSCWGFFFLHLFVCA